MRFALLELRRRPGRFAVAGGALTLLVVLLLLLGGLLDGLFLGSTGAIRAQEADLFVFSAEARESIVRSRIPPELRRQVEEVDGVRGVGGIGIAQLGAAVPGEDGLIDVAVIGYERPTSQAPEPPPPGEAWADRRLEAEGVEVGDRLEVGPARIPVEVRDWIDDSSYLLQGGLWVDAETWREIQSSARPDAAVGDGVFQILVADVDEGADASTVAGSVDEATGATDTLTKDEAVLSLPGTSAQNSTFTALIGMTLLVAGLVIALFFSLLVIERLRLFATLKALGAPSRRLLGGLMVQAAVVAAGACVLGGVLAALLGPLIPPEVPVRIEPTRALISAALVVVTAVIGTAVTFRRIARIEPASAIS